MDIKENADELEFSNACVSQKKALLTYKRRRRCMLVNRDQASLATAEERGEEAVSLSQTSIPPSYISPSKKPCIMTPEKLSKVDVMWKSSSQLQWWKNQPEVKRTVVAKRVYGQYFLDLGQADFSHTTCPSCGLVYARGQESDEKVHTSFHKSQLQGILFRGWTSERVASRLSNKGDRVIYVLPGDPPRHFYKVQEVIGVMEKEMGLVSGWLWRSNCKVYLFITAAKIVGCIVAEQIKRAFPVVAPEMEGKLSEHHADSSVTVSVTNRKSTETMLIFGNWRFRREVVSRKRARSGDEQDLGRVIRCCKTSVSAVCGVRGIWVARSERRKGVASHLLDCHAEDICLGFTVQPFQIAFSQPTHDGWAFAAHYCGTPAFNVYK